MEALRLVAILDIIKRGRLKTTKKSEFLSSNISKEKPRNGTKVELTT